MGMLAERSRLGAPARGQAVRGIASLLGVLAVAAAGAPAGAQHGIVPPEDRPLHQRLAAARIVAIATVTDVREGRIAFEAATPIVGEIEPEFEVKRAPSHPPPWIVGDRALLLLAGARSPYSWVEKPVETIALADAAAERRVADAVVELRAVLADAIARRDLYARWSDGPDEDLAAVGHRGLMEVQGMVDVLDEAFALDRLAVATDLARPLPVRRRAARIAARNPVGIARLLAWVERTAPDTDPEIAEYAIQSGLIVRDPAVEPCLVGLLATPESDLGRIGFRFAGLAGGPDLERKLSELAVGHSDEGVRNEAVQALQGLRRTRAQRGG